MDHDASFKNPSVVCNEAAVNLFFYSNILSNLEDLIERAIPERHLKFVPEQQIPESGIPDYAFIENGHPRFFIELKTPWNISGILSNNTTVKKKTHASRTPSGKFSGTWGMQS